MKAAKFLVVLAFTVELCSGANILAIAAFGGKSHFNIIGTILKALAERGHEVDVVSNFPLKTPIPRYNDLSIRGAVPLWQNNLNMNYITEQNILSKFALMMNITGKDVCETAFKSKTMQNLRNSTKKYDLILLHHISSHCMLGFSHVFSAPTVFIITSVSLPWISGLIGLPDNPSYIPNYFTSLLPKMSFLERCINTLTYIVTKVGHDIASNKPANIMAKRFFGPHLPDLEDLAKNVSLVISNSHFTINQPRPVVPNFVEIAGLHLNGNATLPKEFREFLEAEGTKGVIYLSFGSMVVSESLGEKVLQTFFNAFKRLPYKVLWKGTKEKFSKHLEIPENIQFKPWMPQIGILCHPNVKLFISHGGMLSTTESLYCNVPLLGMPLFADQELNIRNSVGKGIAMEVSYKGVTEEKLIAAIESLIQDPQYKTNLEKISRLFKDRPMSALDTAIYWIEYVIRYNGAPHLRSIAADLPWYQYYLVDVALAFIAISLLVVYLLFKLLQWVLSKFLTLLLKKKKKRE